MPRIACLLGWMVLVCAGCAPAPEAVWPFPSPMTWREPPVATAPGFPTPRTTLSPTPGPTATPLVHLVAKGETLGTIAAQYGVTLAALRAANPDVQERFLAVGQALIIPVDAGPVTTYGTPTPSALAAGGIRCWLQPGGGRTCLADLSNPGAVPLGHVILRFALYEDYSAPPTAVQELDLPLSILPAGGRMPVMAFFPPGESQGDLGRVEILSAIPGAGTDDLLPIEWLNQSASDLTNGLEVQAEFRLAAAAKRLDVLLGLLNASGEWIGFRLERMAGDWRTGEDHHLELRAYSLGGGVTDHRLLVEARAE